MHPESDIERIVMRRVHMARALRPLISGGALATLITLLALYGIGREVWVARVFANAPHDFAAVPTFYFAAFEHTRFIVQALTLATLASVIYLARVSAKLIASSLIPARA